MASPVDFALDSLDLDKQYHSHFTESNPVSPRHQEETIVCLSRISLETASLCHFTNLNLFTADNTDTEETFLDYTGWGQERPSDTHGRCILYKLCKNFIFLHPRNLSLNFIFP